MVSSLPRKVVNIFQYHDGEPQSYRYQSGLVIPLLTNNSIVP